MKRLSLFALASFLLAALLVACTSDADEPQLTSEATTETTVTPPPVAVPVTPTPAASLSGGIALFDVRTGNRTAIPVTQPQANVEFGLGDSVNLFEGGNQKRFDFDGKQIPVPVVNAHTFSCDVVDGTAVILGKPYPGVGGCGPVSTDISGTWMLYNVPGPEVAVGAAKLPTWDQWALNRHTDERRLLQAGLVHCGGCDGRFGAEWSPSGRFVYFSEYAQAGRTFLSDLETGTTRVISEGSTLVSAKPSWTVNDTLTYRSPAGAVVLEGLSAGTRVQPAGITWPACFAPSGSYLYGPAPAANSVAIYAIAEQRIIATLSGSFATNGNAYPLACPEPSPLQRQNDSAVIVVARGSDCTGVSVYRDSSRISCVDLPVTVAETKDSVRVDARSVLAGSGSTVAVARITSVGPPNPCTLNPCTPPTIQALAQAGVGNPLQPRQTYEVLVVDTSTGVTRTLAGGLVSPRPPQLIWNDAGTHLLVRWPFETQSGL